MDKATITQDELNSKIHKHLLWINNQPNGEQLVLIGKNLSRLNFIDCNLTGAILRGSDLRASTIKNTVFYQVDLSGALLQHSMISNSKFIGSHLKKTQFGDTTINVCDFLDVNLIKSNFNSSYISYSTFKNVDFRAAFFKDTKINDCDLANCNFIDTNIQKITKNLKNNTIFNIKHDKNKVGKNKKAMLGYKKINQDIILVFVIPKTARIMRDPNSKGYFTNKVETWQIINLDKKQVPGIKSICSNSNKLCCFNVGKITETANFNETFLNEEIKGIHFFLTFEEAKNYNS